MSSLLATPAEKIATCEEFDLYEGYAVQLVTLPDGRRLALQWDDNDALARIVAKYPAAKVEIIDEYVS